MMAFMNPHMTKTVQARTRYVQAAASNLAATIFRTKKSRSSNGEKAGYPAAKNGSRQFAEKKTKRLNKLPAQKPVRLLCGKLLFWYDYYTVLLYDRGIESA